MIVETIIQALDGGTPYGNTDMDFFTASPAIHGGGEASFPSINGVRATPAPTALAAETTAPARGFAGDFYYRIWAVPLVLQVTNAQVGVPIPFYLWNAYPEANTLTAIGSTGAGSLSLDITPPSAFTAIEYREVNITILNNLTPEIDADFDFIFTLGATPFRFLAVVVQFLNFRPDVPIKETWSWLTDILVARNSGEQRIALRGYPRKHLSYQILVADENERREQYDRWYRSVAFDLIMPVFQYATVVTADAAIGATKIFLNPVTLDLRNGEAAIIVDPRTETSMFVSVATLDADGVTLTAPLTQAVARNMILAPAHRSRVANQTGLRMRALHGSVQIEANMLDSDTRSALTRPNNLATLTTFDGYTVLNLRPLAEADVPELMERDLETLDNQTGIPDINTAWPHAFPLGQRQFLVNRELAPIEMDFWRKFGDAVVGMREPFLHSTYRPDLTQVINPTTGSSTLRIIEGRYATDYHPHNTFKRIEIEMVGGSILRRVVQDADLEADGTATLVLSAAFGAVTSINRISFLNLVRLNSDDIELEHQHLYSWVDISIRAVDR